MCLFNISISQCSGFLNKKTHFGLVTLFRNSQNDHCKGFVILNGGLWKLSRPNLSFKEHALNVLYVLFLYSLSMLGFFLIFLLFVFLSLLGFFGHLLLLYVFLSSTLHHDWVFLLSLVLWQKLSILDNAWHWPSSGASSWWRPCGGYSSLPLLYLLLLKVTEYACDCHCSPHQSLIFLCL